MKDQIYKFIRQQQLGVLSTVNLSGKPEAAVVGITVSNRLEIVFDTVKSSRKYQNILKNPDVALVIGWDNETTVQYEGLAGVLGDDNDAQDLKQLYFTTFPDGRLRAETWAGLVHIRVSPLWIRYSNFNDPQLIKELAF